MKTKRVVLASSLWTLCACAAPLGDDADVESELQQRIPVGVGASTADAGASPAEDAARPRIPVGVGSTTDAGAAPSTPEPPPPPSTPVGSTAASTPTSSSVSVRDPNGLYFANVVASGVGCPAGSWRASISPDGKVFTLTFSRYAVQLSATELADRRTIDCTINIAMNSPGGVSYGITALSYSGYAYLDRGMTGTVTAYYNFVGQQLRTVNGSGIRATSKELVGPYDSSFVFEDVVRSTDVVWSECRTQSTLNVNTSLRMRNGQPRGDGFLNLNAIDGRTESKLVLQLNTRACRWR